MIAFPVCPSCGAPAGMCTDGMLVDACVCRNRKELPAPRWPASTRYRKECARIARRDFLASSGVGWETA